MTDFIGLVAVIGSILTILSFLGNILQYRRRKNEEKALRTHIHTSYNAYYAIARCCSRAKRETDVKGMGYQDRYQKLLLALAKIAGHADGGRTQLISYGREHMGYVPQYEHPKEPGKDQPDEVKSGMTPEEFREMGNK